MTTRLRGENPVGHPHLENFLLGNGLFFAFGPNVNQDGFIRDVLDLDDWYPV